MECKKKGLNESGGAKASRPYLFACDSPNPAYHMSP